MTQHPRRLRYQVAASLDGYIAAEDGTYDWLVDDPTIDFAGLFAEFDTLVMGRHTYAIVDANRDAMPDVPDAITDAGIYGKDAYVFSRTLTAHRSPGIHIVSGPVEETIAALKARPGKDLWLFGGGNLARQCFDAGLVDTVEIAVMPILIGSGIPVLPAGARVHLTLERERRYQSGIVMLEYTVRQ